MVKPLVPVAKHQHRSRHTQERDGFAQFLVAVYIFDHDNALVVVGTGVAGFNGATGTFTIAVTATVPPPPPPTRPLDPRGRPPPGWAPCDDDEDGVGAAVGFRTPDAPAATPAPRFSISATPREELG